MRLDLAVDGKTLAELFMVDFMDENMPERKRRLQYHRLLVNESLIEEWEKSMNQETIRQAYSFWFTQALADQTKLKWVNELQAEQSLLVNAASQVKHSVVVADGVSLNEVKDNSTIWFCDKETFGETSKQSVSMREIEEINRHGVKQKHLFSIFETPIHVEVKENQSSELLADYLAFFYDEEMIVQDLYFIKNEKNFKKYIWQRLPSPCRLTIHMSTENGRLHKKRLEREYSATVKSFSEETLHEGYIQTKRFKISIPYRLRIFGDSEKTKREIVNIIKLNR